MEQVQSLTVLLVEADNSLRRLITLGLQHRGMHVVEASSPDAMPALDASRIDLLVLDVDDCGPLCGRSLLDTVACCSVLSSIPIVVLSWDDRSAVDHISSSAANALLTRATCLEKPFDARILYKTIDCLLTAKALADAAAEAEQEAILLASYSRETSPSIWPAVTAAGLLIVVAGMLLQFVIAALGFAIVIVALLLWTLGSRQTVNHHVALS